MTAAVAATAATPGTVRSRELGRSLRCAMERAGAEVADLAAVLGWPPGEMESVLGGRRVPSANDLSALLAVCGVIGSRRGDLLDLARRAHDQTWWQDHGTRVPVRVPALAAHEEHARSITSYSSTLIPDLARTADYTRALLRALPIVPEFEVEERVAETARRQRVLDRARPPRYRAFVDERALTRTGPTAMPEQLRHLASLATRPHVEIRVVPGIHGLKPFTLLEFTEVAPVAYVEHLTSTAFMERPDTVAAHQRATATLDTIALDEAASRQFLAALV